MKRCKYCGAAGNVRVEWRTGTGVEVYATCWAHRPAKGQALRGNRGHLIPRESLTWSIRRAAGI